MQIYTLKYTISIILQHLSYNNLKTHFQRKNIVISTYLIV